MRANDVVYVMCHSFLRDTIQRVIGIVKKTWREGEEREERFRANFTALECPGMMTGPARAMQASETEKNNGRRARGTGEKFGNALKRRQDWRGTKKTRNGGAWHVYLALLAVLTTRIPSSRVPLRPHSLSSFQSHRLFFWFFPVTSPPLPLPCPALVSKVTLGILVEKFGYLISYRRVRQLSPSFFHFFISFRASRSRYSLRIPLASPSLVPRSCPLLFREERSFFSSFIYCSLRDNFISSEKICRVWSLRAVHVYPASGSKNIFHIYNSSLISISRFPCQPFNDCTEDYFFHGTTEIRNPFKKISHADWRALIFTHFPISSINWHHLFLPIDLLAVFIQPCDCFDLSSTPLNRHVTQTNLFRVRVRWHKHSRIFASILYNIILVRDSNCDSVMYTCTRDARVWI